MLKNTKEIIKKNFFFRLFPWDYSHPAGSDLYIYTLWGQKRLLHCVANQICQFDRALLGYPLL